MFLLDRLNMIFSVLQNTSYFSILPLLTMMNLSFVRFYLHVCSFIRREVQYIQDINPRDFHFRKEN